MKLAISMFASLMFAAFHPASLEAQTFDAQLRGLTSTAVHFQTTGPAVDTAAIRVIVERELRRTGIAISAVDRQSSFDVFIQAQEWGNFQYAAITLQVTQLATIPRLNGPAFVSWTLGPVVGGAQEPAFRNMVKDGIQRYMLLFVDRYLAANGR